MKLKKTSLITAGVLAGALTLTGCSSDDSENDSTEATSQSAEATTEAGSSSQESEAAHGGHEDMEHPADGGPAPAGIKEAENPTFKVGSQVKLSADHMPGMQGATATVVGAYSTNTYSVNYEPTDGGEPVKDHKWVVQEELKDAGEERLADGAEVTITAEHMKGMKNAKGTVESSTDETVYMVDYEDDGMTMKNHKWVVESEMEPLDN